MANVCSICHLCLSSIKCDCHQTNVKRYSPEVTRMRRRWCEVTVVHCLHLILPSHASSRAEFTFQLLKSYEMQHDRSDWGRICAVRDCPKKKIPCVSHRGKKYQIWATLACSLNVASDSGRCHFFVAVVKKGMFEWLTIVAMKGCMYSGLLLYSFIYPFLDRLA